MTSKASLPSAMKAWLYSKTAGGLEKNLSFSTNARMPPAPRRGQVLVKVLSAAINPADYKVPEMGAIFKLVLTTPASPGMDFCGRIVAVGAAVEGFSCDDLVFGSLGIPSQFGSLGEYLVAGTEQIAHVPAGVAVDAAASLGIAGQTAYQSVVPYVSSGDRVFINGGAGGCGIFAIQIAKLLGCQVTTTCSTRNVQFCRDLGADQVIDYTVEDVVSVLRSHGPVYSLALDHIGSPDALFRESQHFLLPGKTFVQVGASAMATFAGRLLRPGFLGGGRRKYHIFFFKNTKAHLVQLADWLHQGKLNVVFDSTFAYEDSIHALEKLRSGHCRGKVVIHVAESADLAADGSH